MHLRELALSKYESILSLDNQKRINLFLEVVAERRTDHRHKIATKKLIGNNIAKRPSKALRKH